MFRLNFISRGFHLQVEARRPPPVFRLKEATRLAEFSGSVYLNRFCSFSSSALPGQSTSYGSCVSGVSTVSL